MSANRGQTRIEEPTRAQRALARRTAESRATVPHLELSAEIDMTACLALDPGPSRTAMLVRACALALQDFPRANAAYRDGRFELYSRVNVAIAVPADDAYVLATVFDAERKSLSELTVEIGGFAGRSLTPPELSGATFSLWEFDGVLSASPVIVSPHAAALAAGGVRALPVVHDGAIVPGHAMTITLACDHRILYGQLAVAFLLAIKARLETAAL